MIFRRRKNKVQKPSAAEFLPPEGVPLKLPIAGVGVRLAAQITDILITLVAMLCIIIPLVVLNFTRPQTVIAIGVLLFFLIRIPYYVVSELAWNGQTLGKRLMKIKVVAHDGGSLTTHSLVLRNLMKEAEIFLPAGLLITLNEATPVASGLAVAWIALALAVPLLNRHRRRLGDLMAGTHVIHMPVPILLKDLVGEKSTPIESQQKFTFMSHQLDHYGTFELQTLESLLRAQSKLPPNRAIGDQRTKTVAEIVEKIRNKISFADPVLSADRLEFLREFYNAQRRHLEQRQLFGERRKDKYFASSDSDP